MGYRDENEAARARNEALEDEVRALREENERLKHRPHPTPGRERKKPSTPQDLEEVHQASLRRQADIVKANGGDRKTYEERVATAQTRIILASVLGGPILAAMIITSAYFATGFPETDQSVAGIFTVSVAAIALPSQFLRLRWPWVPVVTRDPVTNEPISSIRSPLVQRIFFVVPLVLFLIGVGLLFVQGRRRHPSNVDHHREPDAVGVLQGELRLRGARRRVLRSFSKSGHRNPMESFG